MQALAQKTAFVSAVQAKPANARRARAAVVVRAQSEEAVRDGGSGAQHSAIGPSGALISGLSQPPMGAPRLTLCPPLPLIRPAPDVQGVDRRAALGLLAAAAAVSTAQPSQAAYGDAARVFAGKITNKSGELAERSPMGRSRDRASAHSLDSACPGPPATAVPPSCLPVTCPHRLCPIRRRRLCAPAAQQVEPLPPEGVPWHRAAVGGGRLGARSWMPTTQSVVPLVACPALIPTLCILCAAATRTTSMP